MIQKMLFLFLVLFLVSCGTKEQVDETNNYNESDVVLSDVPEPVEAPVVEEKIEEVPKVDNLKKEAEEKLDAFKEKYKEAQKLVIDYDENQTIEAQSYMDSSKDLLDQAEKEFEKGDYEKSIKYSVDALDLLEVKF